MKRIKHSKIKNTGLVFELLVRQVASDVMNNNESIALSIVKKFFWYIPFKSRPCTRNRVVELNSSLMPNYVIFTYMNTKPKYLV